MGCWLMMNGKAKVALIVFAVLVISGMVSFITVVALMGKSDKIFPGVAFRGIQLGNMSKTEARSTLDEYVNSLKDITVSVKLEGGAGEFKIADIGLQFDTVSLLDKAWSVGRNGNFVSQLQERKNVARNGREIPGEFSYDKNKLSSILDNLTKEVRLSPRDASIVISSNDTVQILESKDGRGFDLENVFDQVKSVINGDSDPEIVINTVVLKPAQTTLDLANLRVNGEIARFTTAFDLTKTNRVFNIRVAAEALDGQMIKPGQVFSFNDVVGPRSQEAGYKLAPAILNNEFIDSLGGGVCQVSTTLYNALLQADVEILQRSNHSLTVKYVPLGQDAAVAYGGKDLRFKNNLPCAVIIKALVSGNRVTLKLFGDVSIKKTVHIVNNIIKEYPFQIVYKNDATLAQGTQNVNQKGAKGYRVVSRKLVYQNNKLVGQKSLSASYYAPLDQIVLVGTKPVAKPPSSPVAVPEESPSVPSTSPPSEPPLTPPSTEPPKEPPTGPPTPVPPTEPITEPPAITPEEPTSDTETGTQPPPADVAQL